jgi:hypothetical protein
MQQVADWLEKLGLGQYAQRFAENDISFVILPDLADEDLEKIGVASLGHRRLLLRAIGALDSVAKGTANPASTPADPIVPPHGTAERRQRGLGQLWRIFANIPADCIVAEHTSSRTSLSTSLPNEKPILRTHPKMRDSSRCPLGVSRRHRCNPGPVRTSAAPLVARRRR